MSDHRYRAIGVGVYDSVIDDFVGTHGIVDRLNDFASEVEAKDRRIAFLENRLREVEEHSSKVYRIASEDSQQAAKRIAELEAQLTKACSDRVKAIELVQATGGPKVICILCRCGHAVQEHERLDFVYGKCSHAACDCVRLTEGETVSSLVHELEADKRYLEAENARLREVLQEARAWMMGWGSGTPHTRGAKCETVYDAHEAVAAALSEERPAQPAEPQGKERA